MQSNEVLVKYCSRCSYDHLPIYDKGAFTHDRTIGFTRKILQVAKVYFVCISYSRRLVDTPDALRRVIFFGRRMECRKDRYIVRLMGQS